MTGNGSKNLQHAIDRFWHNYLFILEKNSVPKKSRQWYRRHLEEYIAAHPGVKLQRHTPRFIDDYQNAKGGIKFLRERYNDSLLTRRV